MLAVEDDHDLRHFYETLLGEAGYDVRTAADGGEALAEIDQRQPDRTPTSTHISVCWTAPPTALMLRTCA